MSSVNVLYTVDQKRFRYVHRKTNKEKHLSEVKTWNSSNKRIKRICEGATPLLCPSASATKVMRLSSETSLSDCEEQIIIFYPPPPSLLPVPSSLGERSCRARFTLLGYHAHWSQTNRSHFPGSFPHCGSHSFTRHAIVAFAAAEKRTKKVSVLPECHLVMGFFFPPHCNPLFGSFSPIFFLELS